jgi:hypothetical protein
MERKLKRIILTALLAGCASDPCIPTPEKPCPVVQPAANDDMLSYFMLYHLFTSPSRTTTVYVPSSPSYSAPKATPAPKASRPSSSTSRSYSSSGRSSYSSSRSFSSGRR